YVVPRTLNNGKGSNPLETTVAANFILNSDSSGGHRIAIRASLDKDNATRTAMGWAPYNPVSIAQILEQARDDLMDCFYETDLNTGKMTTRLAFEKSTGKSKKQFQFDLMRLAVLGERLYSAVICDARAFDDSGAQLEPRDWEATLSDALRSARLIQISRTQ